MLRDYQAADVAALSPLVRDHSTVFYQLPTGAGKTAIVAHITSVAFSRSFRVWFVVPRNELLQQASAHLAKWRVPHGLIAAGIEESRAYRVHIVSKDTLLRRLQRIKNWPDLLIFDEAHLYYDAQLLIIGSLPPTARVLGISATPERLDGRGLADIYEAIHYGPSIPWLTERGFLVPLRYFAPPIEGLEKIHRRGTEYDADELDELLEKRKVYGDVVRYYQMYGMAGGRRRSALIFTRSVRSAHETASRFQEAGLAFHAVWGTMPSGERNTLITGLREGRIDGLVSCELLTYGLDVPRVEYGASIRPTLSRALYFQMVGRILRPAPGKSEALFFDHANLVEEHGEPSAPGVPLFYLDRLAWNFEGRERRERARAEVSVRLCPFKDYQYCADPACRTGCKMDPQAALSRRRALETVDVPLQERTPARGWHELQPEERREVQDRIGAATDAYLEALAEDPPRIDFGPIGELLRIAEELGRSPMWVYWHLVEREQPRHRGVNVPLLHEIARQKDYKPGWAWYKRKEIERGIREKEEMTV
jgi:superfamily II DNA or RNA helicase